MLTRRYPSPFNRVFRTVGTYAYNAYLFSVLILHVLCIGNRDEFAPQSLIFLDAHTLTPICTYFHYHTHHFWVRIYTYFSSPFSHTRPHNKRYIYTFLLRDSRPRCERASERRRVENFCRRRTHESFAILGVLYFGIIFHDWLVLRFRSDIINVSTCEGVNSFNWLYRASSIKQNAPFS